ncbi:hypothetical protein [Streptomyces pseudogriseolus]|uniref:hypothetical protein n=1 Tax=Streptomyces pseudogriseolus TaxID=36817 RepID=UPI000A3D3E5C
MARTLTLIAPAPFAARSLFVGAFNTVYEDDARMWISVVRGDGTRVSVSGALDDWAMNFRPEGVAAVLDALTAALDDPEAVITVTSLLDWDAGFTGSAWRIADGTEIGTAAAAEVFADDPAVGVYGDQVKPIGAPWVVLSRDMDTSDLTFTALTQPVKDVIARHGA